MLTAVADKWTDTVLPTKYTLKYFADVFARTRTLNSIFNSFFYSIASTAVDIVLGVAVAFLVVRYRVWGSSVMDTMAMLPLAIPGIVVAFGYVTGFSNTLVDPRVNPTILLIIAYAIRRLPYMVRSSAAGLQQTSEVLEEASLNLGASPATTVRRIVLPLVAANVIAGSILCFSFAMLEVSDSIILAMKESYYPITL
jgi:iron(III) transport system permease protein